MLEVGAGLGANVPYLHHAGVTRWLSLEPDAELAGEYRSRREQQKFPASCEIVEGTLDTLDPESRFDSILYVDVLEHIEDDQQEFERALGRLKPGGHLVILCPAHQFLYSPFDQAIGHFRRYNKRMYRALSTVRPTRLEYLDTVGLLASIANKLLLKQSYPTEKQISLWDRVFVRASLLIDPLTLRLMGKSILGVWTR